jgi:hypothetical protein
MPDMTTNPKADQKTKNRIKWLSILVGCVAAYPFQSSLILFLIAFVVGSLVASTVLKECL